MILTSKSINLEVEKQLKTEEYLRNMPKIDTAKIVYDSTISFINMKILVINLKKDLLALKTN
jgi:hypothetical protein